MLLLMPSGSQPKTVSIEDAINEHPAAVASQQL
jgi:hypothetical protein